MLPAESMPVGSAGLRNSGARASAKGIGRNAAAGARLIQAEGLDSKSAAPKPSDRTLGCHATSAYAASLCLAQLLANVAGAALKSVEVEVLVRVDGPPAVDS